MPIIARLFSKRILVLFFVILGIVAVKSCFSQQQNFYFSPLSKSVYTEKIKLLQSRTIPKIYPDKASQNIYAEIIKERNEAILETFNGNDIVHDTLLLNKCNSILQKLKQYNSNFKLDTIQLYIKRSLIANAACYGEGTVMVNLGLFLWIDNDDELALVLGHEIAHQLLNHSEAKIKSTIATLTSEELKEEIKNIRKSTDGKYYKLKKLLKDLSIQSGKHSTYKESEADSLAVIMCKNAGYNIGNAAKVLLKLNHVEDFFSSNNLYSIQSFLTPTNVDMSFFATKTKYKGLSSVNITMNADKEFDSIKTHPDCIKRYETAAGKNADTAINCCTNLSTQNNKTKERAIIEIARSLYENNSLGYCMHLCFWGLQNNYAPSFFKQMLSLCFSKIYYYDKNLKRFNSVNTEADKGTNLKQLQDYLFQVNTSDIESIAKYYLQNTTYASEEDEMFSNLMFQTQVKDKDKTIAYEVFIAKFPNSKYNYLIQKK